MQTMKMTVAMLAMLVFAMSASATVLVDYDCDSIYEDGGKLYVPDVSGNNHPGKNQAGGNASPFSLDEDDPDGIAGDMSLLIDGGPTKDDYGVVKMQNMTDIDLSANGAFTLETWVKPLAYSTGDTSTNYLIRLSGSDFYAYIAINDDGTAAYRMNSRVNDLVNWEGFNVTTTTVVPSEEWSHMMMRYDEAAGKAQLLLNGTVIDTQTGVTSGLPGMGGLNGDNQLGRGWDLKVDDARVHDTYVPEPATLGLAGLGGLALLRRRG
jgi:hypothetical protein